jgi:hypothetical protein
LEAQERTGVLVIRAWLEKGAENDALRARITSTSDVGQAAPIEAVSTSESEIVAIVRAWLQELAVPE